MSITIIEPRWIWCAEHGLRSGHSVVIGGDGAILGIMPEVPPMAETTGLEDMDIRSWNALMVPRATPDAEVARLHAGIRRMAAAPDFAPALLNIGYDAVTTESPAATDAMIAEETPRWRRLVEISGARAG